MTPFGKTEITALQKSPEVLRILAAYHDIKADEALLLGFGNSQKYHDSRMAELLEEAQRIESEQ